MAEILGITASIVGLSHIIQKTIFALRDAAFGQDLVHPTLIRLEQNLSITNLLLESISKSNLPPSWSKETLRDLEPVVREFTALAKSLALQYQGSFSMKWDWGTDLRAATKKLDEIEARLAAITSTLPARLTAMLDKQTRSVATRPQLRFSDSSSRLEGSAYGLEVLHEPTTTPNRAGNLNIVFVHGLNTSSMKTWGAVEKYWPKDLLPQDVPEARILTYDYDSRIPISSSLSNTDSAEKTFVDSVMQKCGQKDSSPSLIFCAHSFGGVLLQKAVGRCRRTSSIDQSSRDFLAALKGFIFLGTPRFSNRTASFQSFFEKLGTLVPRKAFSNSLGPPSESVINDLNAFEDFVEDENLPVFSFFESQPTVTSKGLVKIVMPERKFPTDDSFFLRGDHLSMCRFQTRHDDGYIKVSQKIRQLVRSGSGSDTTFKVLSHTNISKMDLLNPLKIVNDLQPESHTLIQAQEDYFDKRQKFIEKLKDRIRPKRPSLQRISGFEEWILTTEHFKNWRSEDGQRCLVIIGQAGSGRTNMVQFLEEESKRAGYGGQPRKFGQPGLTLSYFCDWTQPSRDKALIWLYDPLLQLLELDVTLFKEIYRKLETPPTTYSDLEALVLRLLQTSSWRDIDLMIDGLDECDPESLNLIQRTITTVKTSDDEGKIRLLLTTNNLIDVPKTIANQSEKLVLDSYVERRNQQIEAFIDNRLRRSPNRHRYSADLLADVSRELYQKASIRPDMRAAGSNPNETAQASYDQPSFDRQSTMDVSSEPVKWSESLSLHIRKIPEGGTHESSEGNFIWISLAVDIIEAERSVGNIRKMLQSLPLTIGPLYDMILRKIPPSDQGFTARVLHFIGCAIGPLGTDALAFALALNGEQTTMREVLDEQNIDLQASLISLTGSLLVFDNGSVSFSHQTFSRYLHDAGRSSILSLPPENSDNDIAMACLRCLMLSYTNNPEPAKVSFLAYSERHWFEHVKRASDVDGKLRELLISFATSERLWTWLTRRRATQFDMLLPESSNHYHILAALDLLNDKDILTRLSQPGGIDTLDTLGRTPLHYALANNASKTIEFLVEQRSSREILDQNGWSCAHFAVYSGDIDLIQKFSTRGPLDPSLLSLAIDQRHWAVVDQLFNRYIPELPVYHDVFGRGIIHKAVSSRDKAVVDKLLNRGLDLDLTDHEGMNALHLAAKLGEYSIAKALVESASGKRQFSIEATDLRKNTALHLATEAGDIDVVRLLVEHHASLEHTNKNGQLPLHIAAMYGYENIVDLLLAVGSPINTDDERPSPLHMASAWGWNRVALKLIKAGAYIESRDEKGRTPLYLAACNGSGIMVDLLLRYKANPNIADFEKRSPLHVAARGGWEPVVSLLLKKAVEVNTTTRELSRTPLHYAALSKNPSDGLVKRLLDAGANLTQKDKDGNTAFDLAKTSENTLIAELLLKAQEQQQQHGMYPRATSPPFPPKKTFDSLAGPFSATSIEIFDDVEVRQRRQDLDVFSRLKDAGL